MTKLEFILEIEERINALPEEDVQRSLEYYTEMIEDRMEEGLSEEEAVAALGDPDDIVDQILSETPLTRLVKARAKPRRALGVWEIILLVLGSPVWISVIAALLAAVISLYTVPISLLITFWALFAFFTVSAPMCLVGSAVLLFGSEATAPLYALLFLGSALVLAALAILFFYAALGVTRLAWYLFRLILKGSKRALAGKR